MPDAFPDSAVPGPDTLARQALALPAPRLPPLFRVVEVSLTRDGRLKRSGQIWHADLDHVRRFGRALAANSVSQQVLVTDTSGAVLERIPVAPQGDPAGWTGWRELPLPPAPLGRKARRLPVLPAPTAPVLLETEAAPPPMPMSRQRPAVDLPVVQAELPAGPPVFGTLTHA